LAGEITGLDTSAFTAGTQLYLSSTTAGAYTSTKQYAPNHLVYIGVVTRSHVNQGSIEVRIQNGYEMDELHNVSAQNPTDGQVLIYNDTTDLWEKANLTAGTAIGVSNGAGSITINNTGVTSAVAGTGISVSGATGAVTITNSAPDQTVALTSGTGISTSGTYPNFTISNTGVTSVGVVAPVATTGGTTPTISLASGYGDTLNPYASKTANYVLAAPNGSAGVPTFRAIVAADIPTLNQNTTGTASNVTGTVAIANGGTGQTTATAAFNALAPSQTSNSGKYLTTDGTNTSWATVSAGASLSNDTSTTSNLYPLFASATSGTPTTVYTSNAKLLYKPSTGELQSSILNAGNGIVVNSKTVSTSYTIASGNSAMSVGAITIASGQSVTVSSGSRWVVL